MDKHNIWKRLKRAAVGFFLGFAGAAIAIRLYFILGMTSDRLAWSAAIITAVAAIITTKDEDAQP